MEPTPAELDALGKLFAQEICFAVAPRGERLKGMARLPKPMLRRLEEKGWIEKVETQIGRDVLGPIVVSYYALTMPGHLLYCQHCATLPDEELK